MIYKYLDIKKINRKIDTDLKKLILDTESKYRGQLFNMAKSMKKKPDTKIILIAGPSCAGKTTTSRLLKEILELSGKDVVAISMDDFYIDLDKRGVMENGKPDFESPDALDYSLMNKCFTSYFSGAKTTFPTYDFKAAKNNPNGFELTKKENTIVILEGLHALNPKLLQSLGTKDFFRMYIGDLTSFRLNGEQLTTKDLRLLRRTVRDIERRGYSPKQTKEVWPEVVSAEVQYIDPYKNNVDFYIDTTHEYELGIFKNEIARFISEGKMTEQDIPFKPFIDAIRPVSKELLPSTTLMWEFVDPPKED